MQVPLLAFMELFIVLAFAAGWLVLELVARRLDGRREQTKPSAEGEGDSGLPPDGSNSPPPP